MNAPVEQTNALAQISQTATEAIIVTDKGLDYNNFSGLWKIATLISRSKLAPSGFDSIESIAVAVAKGRAVGLDPFQSMESMAIINGRAVMYGDAPLAVARQSPYWDEAKYKEWFEQAGKPIKGYPTAYADDTAAVCRTHRLGNEECHEVRFSVADAKLAGLWGKKSDRGVSPWCAYPYRMLMFRARGYNLRDSFGDVLKGLGIRELVDEPIDVTPESPEPSVENFNAQLPGHGAPTPEEVAAVPDVPTPAVQEPPITDADLPENLQAPDPLKGLREKIYVTLHDLTRKESEKQYMIETASAAFGRRVTLQQLDTDDEPELLNSVLAWLQRELKGRLENKKVMRPSRTGD